MRPPKSKSAYQTDTTRKTVRSWTDIYEAGSLLRLSQIVRCDFLLGEQNTRGQHNVARRALGQSCTSYMRNSLSSLSYTRFANVLETFASSSALC